MLERKYRWPGRITSDFFLQSRVWNRPWGRIYFRVDTDVEARQLPQIAILTPKKSFPLSVDRNRAKRLATEDVQSCLRQYRWPRSYIVISLNPTILHYSQSSLLADLNIFCHYNFDRKLTERYEEKCGKI